MLFHKKKKKKKKKEIVLKILKINLKHTHTQTPPPPPPPHLIATNTSAVLCLFRSKVGVMHVKLNILKKRSCFFLY